MRAVAEVQPKNIGAGLVEVCDSLGIPAGGPQSCNDFGVAATMAEAGRGVHIHRARLHALPRPRQGKSDDNARRKIKVNHSFYSVEIIKTS
jgi:hypothetical protein